MLMFMFLSRQTTGAHLVTHVTGLLRQFSKSYCIYCINIVQLNALPKHRSIPHVHDAMPHHHYLSKQL